MHILPLGTLTYLIPLELVLYIVLTSHSYALLTVFTYISLYLGLTFLTFLVFSSKWLSNWFLYVSLIWCFRLLNGAHLVYLLNALFNLVFTFPNLPFFSLFISCIFIYLFLFIVIYFFHCFILCIYFFYSTHITHFITRYSIIICTSNSHLTYLTHSPRRHSK